VIVIDVGCARYGGDHSIERLIEWYHPNQLIGYDPGWTNDMLTEAAAGAIVVYAWAAWTYDGEVRWLADGLNSQVGDAEHWALVPCVDLARVIRELPDEEEVILKIDAEGAEYDLLEHLLATGAIHRLSRLLIEWHPTGQGPRRRAIEDGLRKAEIVTEQWRW